jgi:uncharacterized protein (TIGR02466 family)
MKKSFFCNEITVEENFSFLNDLINFTDKYIEKAKQDNQKYFINNKDFGMSHHSQPLFNDVDFKNFVEHILNKSYSILDEQGYDLKEYRLIIRDLWVQEFSKEGGGHHVTHTHSSGHISGFYFLKCSENTSYPIFHDPRPGKMMIQLPEKNTLLVTESSERVFLKPKPGTFIFFNSYLPHEFQVDHGIEPFRFIHFNIQAVFNNK